MRVLLLQIRDADDPIAAQEADVFVRAIGDDSADLHIADLLTGGPTEEELQQADIVIIGGSGNYSAVDDEPWLESAFTKLRWLHDHRKPTFAICWGCQAMARVLGGRTIHDSENGELGSIPVKATPAAADDPLFGPLGNEYNVFQGHTDRVAELPPNAILLASSDRVPIQAFTFPDRPMYATQFHPELCRKVFLERVRKYPSYIEELTGKSYDDFASECGDATEAHDLLRKFVELTLAARG